MPKEGLTPGEDESYIPIWAPAKGSDPSLRSTVDIPYLLAPEDSNQLHKGEFQNSEPEKSNPKAEALAIFLATIARQARRK